MNKEKTIMPNAFEVLQQVKNNMRKSWMTKQEADKKVKELIPQALSWNYDYLLEVCSPRLTSEEETEELAKQV